MDVKLGNVLYPARDLAELVAFYRDGVGMPVKFQDGDRYAALDGGGATFALTSGTESVASSPVASFKVTDLDAAIARVRAAGGTAPDAVEGPHEWRTTCTDPASNSFVLYAAK